MKHCPVFYFYQRKTSGEEQFKWVATCSFPLGHDLGDTRALCTSKERGEKESEVGGLCKACARLPVPLAGRFTDIAIQDLHLLAYQTRWRIH